MHRRSVIDLFIESDRIKLDLCGLVLEGNVVSETMRYHLFLEAIRQFRVKRIPVLRLGLEAQAEKVLGFEAMFYHCKDDMAKVDLRFGERCSRSDYADIETARDDVICSVAVRPKEEAERLYGDFFAQAVWCGHV